MRDPPRAWCCLNRLMRAALFSTRIIVATKRPSSMIILLRRLFFTGHSWNVRYVLEYQRAVFRLRSRADISARVREKVRLEALRLRKAKLLRNVRCWCSDDVNLRGGTAIHQWSAQSTGVAIA